jgi:FKBP-type peptidyl-prolyl cis-trans isomerase FkpA
MIVIFPFMRKLLFLGMGLVAMASFGKSATPVVTPKEVKTSTDTNKAKGKMTTITKGLEYEELKVGTGAEATSGKTVSVHYTGWLTNGTKFDSSVDRGQPFTFPLGGGQVIQGWDQGFAGMKIGGKRKLYIDPEMGYGTRGAPPVIPPNSKLIFEVELLAVK